jgi:GPH family glycoside/pentoside/hexuronide:cation symporter
MAAKRISHPPQALQALVPQQASIGILILYAIGQLGWSLASYSVSNLLIYFYMPPEQGTPVFPAFVFQGAVLGILTLIGIVSAAGRFLDAVIDPLVANWSDRKQSGLGKRRWFLLWGALPFALSGFLVFYPLNHDESASNFVWLLGVIAVYYFFFAFYVIPYTALIAELGHTAKDRLLISTLLSVTWALGFIGGTQVYGIQSYLVSQGKTALEAFQMAILWINGIALVCMLLPALFLNEKKYARQAASEHSIKQALKIVLGNQNFRWFLLSDLIYWISLNFIQLGVGFYTTLLLGLDIAYASVFSALGFLASFVFYAPINLMASRFGKKRLMLISFLLFAIIFGVLSFVQWIPVPKHFILYGLAIASAFPLAVFGILPNALIGDEVEKEERLTGRQLSGMFYGVRAFVMKVGISLGNLVFPSLLLFGKSQDNPAGVQLTALAALAFCVAGWQVFRKYEEPGGNDE